MTLPNADETDTSSDRQQRGVRFRRRWIVAIVAIVVLAAAATSVLLASVNQFAGKHTTQQDATDDSEGTSLAAVTRRDLSSQMQVSATLGYAGNYTVVYQGGSASSGSTGSSGVSGSSSGGSAGTFTELPPIGAVVSQGHVLYRVNNRPVILLYGGTPAYRTLAEGSNAGAVTGPDVAELNSDLVEMGYATHREIPAGSDEFTWQTRIALEKLQAHLGLRRSGVIQLGEVVFLPSPARVTSESATLGAQAQSGGTVLQASSDSRQVNIALAPSQQTYVKVGDKVSVILPNGQATPGVVSSVGTVATSSSGSGSGSSGSSSDSTITVLVTPTDPAKTGAWDEAPVSVTITTTTARNALVVPVTALVANTHGYAVEVVGANRRHRLIPVSLGVFDDADGLVQVTGATLAAGQHLVVPTL